MEAKNEIKVSVIIPVYNVEKYINRCLISIRNQTLKEIEVIIVNDGSQDRSVEIIQDFIQSSKQKVLLLEKENGGLSDARNFGIPYATGEYITFLDSDDYIEKEMYSELYEEAKKLDLDYISCDFIWEYPDKQKTDRGRINNSIQDMFIYERVVAWNKLIRRKIIIEHNIRFSKGLYYEDIDFFYKLLPYLNSYSYYPVPFVHYIQRDSSISNVQTEKTADIFQILENVENYYIEQNLYEKYFSLIEYSFARYLLCSSFFRMTKIKDNALFLKLTNRNWQYLHSKYPNWRKNYHLKENSDMKSIYMKTVNKFTYNIYKYFFRIFKN